MRKKSLSAKVGQEQAAAGSSICAVPFHWVHGDWWQGGYHQCSQGTCIGDSHADGCGTGRHVPCWVAPEGRCPAASSRAGGCTPGCHTGAGRPGTGWAMPSAAGVGLRHGPAPGAYPTSLFAVVLHVRSKPAPLAAKFALLGLVEAPQKASAQPRCQQGGRGSQLPHPRQQSHISAAFVVLQKNHRQSPPPWPWSNMTFPLYPLEPPQHRAPMGAVRRALGLLKGEDGGEAELGGHRSLGCRGLPQAPGVHREHVCVRGMEQEPFEAR